jgi:cell division protein ZapA
MADKSSTTTPGSSTVHVEIFGQTYTVKAGADPGYVEELAAHVDAQMREVSKTAGAVDSVRVAVLAALNIADECFRLRRQVREGDEKTAARAASILRELAAVVGE